MNMLESLNEQQKKAVLSDNKRLLILAGAGSGKTHTVITKIAYLIGNGKARGEDILALTFSNKAAKEMEERVVKYLEDDSVNVYIKTFHKLGSYILRMYGHLIGVGEFNIYTPDDAVDLMKLVYPDQQKKDLKEIISLIFEAKDRGFDSKTYSEWKESKGTVAKYFTSYEEALRNTGCVDFADLINLSYKLLVDFPDVRQELRYKWKYIFVDEFQDTNRMQFNLLSQLVGDENYLCVVGDDDQSIYAFRGAENEHILNFNKNYENAEVIKLEQNYRSTKNILALSNSLIQENIKRNDKVLWTENVDGEVPKLMIFDSNSNEEKFISRIIQELNGTGTMCIIYRNNSQSAGFENELMQKGIPYSVFKGNSLFQREEIKDCIAYFSLALNPKDISNFCRIISKPSRGIGAKTMDKLVVSLLGDDSDILYACSKFEDFKTSQKKEIDKLYQTVNNANEALRNGDVKVFCDLLIKETGLYDMYMQDNKISYDIAFQENEISQKPVRVQNIDSFISMLLANKEVKSKEDILQYIENINLSSQTDVPQEKTVVLSSMHSVKGLEFDTCFVTGLEDEIIPSNRTEDEEEERRLLYVAMTRAKKRLFLSYSLRRFRNGFTTSASPSKFIKDFDKDLYEEKNLAQIYNSMRKGYGVSRSSSYGGKSNWRKGYSDNYGSSKSSSYSSSYSRSGSASSSAPSAPKKSFLVKKDAKVESAIYKVGDMVVNTKSSQSGIITGIRKLQSHIIIDILFENGQKSSFSEGSAFIKKK